MAGLKGAVPILLGTEIAYSGVAGAGRAYSVIFVAVAFSVVAQGRTVPSVARWLKIPMSVAEVAVRTATQMTGNESQAHPAPPVLVAAFDASRHYMDCAVLDPAKQKSVISMLTALNSVLAKGTQAAEAASAQPDFAGHRSCDREPYIQRPTPPRFTKPPPRELVFARR